MIEMTLKSVFESDVIPDSGKTEESEEAIQCGFESDVIPDSGKTRYFR